MAGRALDLSGDRNHSIDVTRGTKAVVDPSSTCKHTNTATGPDRQSSASTDEPSSHLPCRTAIVTEPTVTISVESDINFNYSLYMKLFPGHLFLSFNSISDPNPIHPYNFNHPSPYCTTATSSSNHLLPSTIKLDFFHTFPLSLSLSLSLFLSLLSRCPFS